MSKKAVSMVLVLALAVSLFAGAGMTAAANTEPAPPGIYWGNAVHLKGNNDKLYSFNVIGTAEGRAWGHDVYTDDSIIAVAAVHAGYVAVGETKTVTIRILPGRASYQGTTRFGITTISYDTWNGSYEFVSSYTPQPGYKADFNGHTY